MSLKSENVVGLSCLFLFLMSVYLVFLRFQNADPLMQKTLVITATSLFIGGLILAVFWGYYWGIRKGFQEKHA